MKREEIPEKCRSCYHMKAWHIRMDGNHDYTCWRLPDSMVRNSDCDMYEEDKAGEYNEIL